MNNLNKLAGIAKRNKNMKVKNWYLERITLSQKGKKPRFIIRGTNISVTRLFERLSEGADIEMLFKEYPQLTMKALQACFAYAQDLLESEEWPCDDVPF